MTKNDSAMTPIVNTDVIMPRVMMRALTLHEFACLAKGIESVTTEQVEAFLSARFGDKVAKRFKPDYLIKTPSSLANQQ